MVPVITYSRAFEVTSLLRYRIGNAPTWRILRASGPTTSEPSSEETSQPTSQPPSEETPEPTPEPSSKAPKTSRPTSEPEKQCHELKLYVLLAFLVRPTTTTYCVDCSMSHI
ncbi:hypothetical protein KIN20_032700 [Parelaphostrongylus tenuis]|uniref:Uncharacterized protein n=1 Tax=Parelaphostrongylus tenuis TaxID=148309 RepID=A0AAD5R7L6_PARTN|nr:hypothetical protein KIN20_032700 [Parelaphostrongylus tenuis]